MMAMGMAVVSLQAAPVAFWHFDEARGVSAASTPDGLAAVFSGDVTWALPGARGVAGVALDGKDDFLVAPGDAFRFDRDTPFSAAAWIRGEQRGAIVGNLMHGGAGTGWELVVGRASQKISVWLVSQWL